MSTNDKHRTVQLGIWTIVTNKTSPLVPEWLPSLRTLCSRVLGIVRQGAEATQNSLNEDKKDGIVNPKPSIEIRTITYFFTFIKEIYSVGPLYFIIEILLSVWEMGSEALQLYYTSRLLDLINQSLGSRHLETLSIVQALTGKILMTVFSDVMSRVKENNSALLCERVKYHFLGKTMHSTLNFDILTSEDPEVRGKLEQRSGNLLDQDSEAWDAFLSIKDAISGLLTILASLWMMLGLSQSNSTFFVAIASCLIEPFLNFTRRTLWGHSFVAFCKNKNFERMASLYSLAFDERFREDRITNNLGPYIEQEFKKSRHSLGDTDTENVYNQWFRDRAIYYSVLKELAWDCSIILFSLRVLWDFGSISLNELILIQQVSRSVKRGSFALVQRMKGFSGHLLTIRNIYLLDEIQNKVKGGDLPYPLYSEGQNHTGAEIDFRNVSFKYPGRDRNALTDVSFTIKPGQLVVIVGVNGSGKSSAIRLLARLYDVSSGEILLDGRPISSYKLDDMRRAMAILRQDHPVIPVSLRENIALGLSERRVGDDEIEDAIHQGGAEKLVQKSKQGLETVLDPVNTVITHFVGETDVALKAVVEDKEIKTDLSGGETQRLSASRTFMRLMGGNVRLLVADEPTSALDPEGEYELFKRLREHSGGKTVIFITHRFGHLTKYADLIICLKDGYLVEQGNHEELMTGDGEYKKLYDLQAKAFVLSDIHKRDGSSLSR